MDGCVADAGDGGEHACPVDLLLCLLAVRGTFNYELWEIDLSCPDVTLDGWNDCGGKKKKIARWFKFLNVSICCFPLRYAVASWFCLSWSDKTSNLITARAATINVLVVSWG